MILSGSIWPRLPGVNHEDLCQSHMHQRRHLADVAGFGGSQCPGLPSPTSGRFGQQTIHTGATGSDARPYRSLPGSTARADPHGGHLSSPDRGSGPLASGERQCGFTRQRSGRCTRPAALGSQRQVPGAVPPGPAHDGCPYRLDAGVGRRLPSGSGGGDGRRSASAPLGPGQRHLDVLAATADIGPGFDHLDHAAKPADRLCACL